MSVNAAPELFGPLTGAVKKIASSPLKMTDAEWDEFLSGLSGLLARAEKAEAEQRHWEAVSKNAWKQSNDAGVKILAANLRSLELEAQRDALAAALRLTGGRTVAGLLRAAANGSQAHAPTYLDAADRIDAAMAALESPVGRELEHADE